MTIATDVIDRPASDEQAVRRRFEAMAARFGLTQKEIAVDPDIFRKVAGQCAKCAEAGACIRAFENGEPLPLTLCPNSGVYATLASE